MSGLFSISILATLLGGTVAFAACVPARSPQGCVNLSAIPDIAQQVIGAQKPAPPAEKAPPTLPDDSYHGPRFGMSSAVRRAPEIGYRWSID